MSRLACLILVAVMSIGLAACAAQNAEKDSPNTPIETPATARATSPPVNGDAILIETRIAEARLHTGEVLSGSLLGESAFCEGGESNGSSSGATITAIFTCPSGTLTVQYAPTQRSLVQSAEWEIVSGTGDFEGLRGGGYMVAAFESDNPDAGREVFTGTVGR